jgi:hypothetical protein
MSLIAFFHFVMSQQVHMVRHLRHELAILQTDHKQVVHPPFQCILADLGLPACVF